MSKPDSIDRLIDYTETIKPYRTKVVEVLTTYSHEDEVTVKIEDGLVAAEVPCEPDPNRIHPGVGWDTQPWALYDWQPTNKEDERGNTVYTVNENPENVLYDAPREAPPFNPETDCCTKCDVWLCEGVGWDTQPFSLYETFNTGTVDKHGDPIYATIPNDNNVVFDAPNECPDADKQ